jgi:Uma2 family endonuclease
VGIELVAALHAQLDRRQFRVRHDSSHVRRSADRYYIPDVFVVPTEQYLLQEPLHTLETYVQPLPLVMEIWSPSTGDYDIEGKLPQYQQRGDREIWYIHPYDRNLRAWRRQPDGSYEESVHEHGLIQPMALPGVTIDLDTLFE